MFDLVSADVARYREGGLTAFWEPSLWAIVSYRFGRWGRARRFFLFRAVCVAIDAPIYWLTMVIAGVHIPRSCEIGGGLKIWHFGGVFLNPATRIGRNCTLRQNVCLGSRRGSLDAPRLGDDVEVGVGAVVIGDICLGDNCVVGANAVVLQSVPAGATVAGNPARVVRRREQLAESAVGECSGRM